MKWTPDDDFYEGYSLWQNFGYGPPGEVARAQKELLSLGYETSIDATKELLELTRTLHKLVKNECQEEIAESRASSKRLIIAGTSPPFDVSLAFSIVNLILLAAQAGVSVADYLSKRGQSKSDQSKILESAVKKLLAKKDSRDLIVEKTERWHVSYRQAGKTKGSRKR